MLYSDLFFWLFGGLIPLAVTAFMVARSKALGTEQDGQRLHSLPSYYGWYAVIWLALPAMLSGLAFSIAHLFGLFSIPAPMLLGTMFTLGSAGLWYAMRHIQVDFRARESVEKVTTALLITAASISLLTTLGLVLSVIFDSCKVLSGYLILGFPYRHQMGACHGIFVVVWPG